MFSKLKLNPSNNHLVFVRHPVPFGALGLNRPLYHLGVRMFDHLYGTSTGTLAIQGRIYIFMLELMSADVGFPMAFFKFSALTASVFVPNTDILVRHPVLSYARTPSWEHSHNPSLRQQGGAVFLLLHII